MRIVQNDLPCGPFRPGFFSCETFSRAGLPFVRGSFRAGFFLVCAGLSLVRGSFRAGFFSVWGFFRAGFSSATRTGAIAGRVSACSGLRPLSRALFPAPSFPSPLSCPRYLSAGAAGRAPRRAFPCRSACRRTLPGAFFRVLRACGCLRRTVVPRSVFDSLLKSPGPVLGIPPNFSYLWMQKMSFAALKTYRTE